jgi:hypothetical protein
MVAKPARLEPAPGAVCALLGHTVPAALGSRREPVRIARPAMSDSIIMGAAVRQMGVVLYVYHVLSVST